MNALQISLSILLAATTLTYAVPDISVANRIGYAYPGTPTIDGVVSAGEWDNAMKYVSQPIDNVLVNEGNYPLIAPEDEDDLSGKYWAMWDDDALYLLIQAYDDLFPLLFPPPEETNLSSIFWQHSFTIYTSSAYSRLFGTAYEPGYDLYSDMDVHFQFVDDAMVGTHGYLSFGGIGEPIDTSVMTAYSTFDGGYFAEIKLPWHVILGYNEFTDVTYNNGIFSGGPNSENYGLDRNFIGFDLHLQDQTVEATRKSRLSWASYYEWPQEFRHWNTTLVWGTLVLANPPPCTVVDTVITDAHWTLFEGGFAFGNTYGHFIYTGYCPFVYDFGSNDWWYVFEESTNPDAFYFYSFSDAAWATFYNGLCYY